MSSIGSFKAFLSNERFTSVEYPVVLSKNQSPKPRELFIIKAYCPPAAINAAIPAVRLS